jgi:hypothetical protein
VAAMLQARDRTPIHLHPYFIRS